MQIEGRKRVVVENLRPELDCGRFPIKRVIGEKIAVRADIFADGHDIVSARLLYKKREDREWKEVPMRSLGNDEWVAEFTVTAPGIYTYSVEGWIDHFKTWQRDMKKRYDAGQDLKVEIMMGRRYIREAAVMATGKDRTNLIHFAEKMENSAGNEDAISVALDNELTMLMCQYPDKKFPMMNARELDVVVDRKKALFSTWYELFPRSCFSVTGKHGTFRDCERLVPAIAGMGFDVLYFPPIHPIGQTNRKGRNNSLLLRPDDVGSPWAIGSGEGGHKAVHPELGTLEDLEKLIKKAGDYGMEVALDLAFQCSPDHPYVKEHPEWFKLRPDGSIQYAENPPKKYEDILPLNFESEKWRELWEELKSVVLFWMGKGIRIFRVDNPHTKSLRFWEWLIKEVKREYPEVLFLSEAFSRPKVMYRLAKVGFTQSYTYFTWRNTKRELTDYMKELTETELKEYFKPNFWPNTPDILPEFLQYGGRAAFMIRLVLAATLSSGYGIYGPAFEQCINEAIPGREEYMNSEKYEIKSWDLDKPDNLRDFITRVNKIRKENQALQATLKLRFYEAENDHLLFYGKETDDLSNIILVVVNLDPFHVQSGWVKVPVDDLGIDPKQPYLVHDLLSDDKYIWQGERNYVELDPDVLPANIFRLRKKLRREVDFDYFM